MGEVAVSIVRWTVRAGIIVSVAIAFIVILNFGTSLLAVGLNQSVFGDILGLVQIWLPFNLNVLLTWIFTGAVFIIMYRLAMFVAGLVNKFVGES